MAPCQNRTIANLAGSIDYAPRLRYDGYRPGIILPLLSPRQGQLEQVRCRGLCMISKQSPEGGEGHGIRPLYSHNGKLSLQIGRRPDPAGLV